MPPHAHEALRVHTKRSARSPAIEISASLGSAQRVQPMPTMHPRTKIAILATAGLLGACAINGEAENVSVEGQPLASASASGSASAPPVVTAAPFVTAAPVVSAVPVVTAAPVVKDRCCCTRSNEQSCNGKESGKKYNVLSCTWTQSAPNCGSSADTTAAYGTKDRCDYAAWHDCNATCPLNKDLCKANWGPRD
jgi:hypothetical protein